MMRTVDLSNAVQTLKNGDFTCVLCKKDIILTSAERGVKPLLTWIENGTDTRGFSAADRVVGKGAALLYAHMGVTTLYASVISEPAIAVCQQYGITVSYDQAVPAIRNRSNTGFCPIETAVTNIHHTSKALAVIKNTLHELNQ